MLPRNAVLLAAALAVTTVATVQWGLLAPVERQPNGAELRTGAVPPVGTIQVPPESRDLGRAAEDDNGAARVDAVTQQELDAFAARFAAEPALIDALEDADSHHPQVRAEAEQLLSTLSVDEPDPAQPRP